jgi:hypothetical protein
MKCHHQIKSVGIKLAVKSCKGLLEEERQKLYYLKARSGTRYKYAVTEAYI